MIIRIHYTLILLVFFVLNSEGQIQHGGTPASFKAFKSGTLYIPFIEMEPVKNEELRLEEKIRPGKMKPFVFAKTFMVDIDPSKSGRWEKVGGQKIWVAGIRSRGAYSLNLIFDKMILPEKASLFIYSPDRSRIMGAYTSENEQSSGHFTFYPIPGDEIIVEYNEPEKISYPAQLHILKVNHDFKNIFGTRPLGEAGLCNRDVYCPDVAAYVKEKQAVVDIIVAGHELCTGTLVNNVRQDKKPYMLTAGHCIENSTEAQETLVCFNYESPYCANGKSSLNGYADQTLNGTLLRSRSDSLDFALVELETSPPPEFRPFYAGWNRTGSIPSSTFAIHHPRGDVKKISIDQNSPTISSFSNDFISNSFWLIGKWEAGTTESGSSGGPLFNENKQLIGSLTGGTSTCDDPTEDLFAMFSKQWNHYSTASLQLKAWLDPDNTGSQVIASLNPYGSSVSCDLFCNREAGETYLLQKTGNANGGYISGHNYLKIVQYAERFEQTKQTLLNAVSMGIAKSSSAVNNEQSNIRLIVMDNDSVSGLPKSELQSMTLPLNVLSPVKMNFISLDNPLVLKGKYFISYEINYNNPTDSFAVYHSADRKKIEKNKAFARVNGFWKPFYAIQGIGKPVSLLIESHGCESILADGSIPPGNEIGKFQVLYPQTGVTDYIYLKNNGTEEYVKIVLYDILGKKLFVKEQNVTSTPQIISMANYSSGVYFLAIESESSRQVIKIRINRGK